MSTTIVAEQQLELPQYVVRLIDTVAKREGFEAGQYTIRNETGSKLGDGYQGLMVRVTITANQEDQGDQKPAQTLRLICKIAPLVPARRIFFNTNTTFADEVYVYDVIFPAFAQFQRELNVGAEGFHAYPRCFGTHSDPESGDFALAMGDLGHEGFRLIADRGLPDLQHALKVMREMAQFHAISMAMKKLKPADFAPFRKTKSSLIENYLHGKDFTFQDSCIDQGFLCLRPEDKALREYVQYVRDNYREVIRQCTRIEAEDDRFAVLCHGDCWSNNHMYRYGKGATEAPTDVCILDWQMLFYGNLALDISFYLFCALGQEVRDPHYERLINTYYEALSATLQSCGISKVEEVLTLAELHEQLRLKARFGFVMASVVLPFITADTKLIPDFDDICPKILSGEIVQFTNYVDGTDPAFQVRMRTAIEDFVARGYVLHMKQ